MYLQIALLSPPYNILAYKPSPYFPDEFWRSGMRVLVPLGTGSIRSGIVMELNDRHDPAIRYRELLWPLENYPLFDPIALKMVKDLCSRQGLKPGFVLGNVLPAGLRATSQKLSCQKKQYSPRQLGCVTPVEGELLAKAFIEGTAFFSKKKYSEDINYILNGAPPWKVRPAALTQRAILDYLYEKGSATLQELRMATGKNARMSLESLITSGLIKVQPDEETEGLLENSSFDFELNEMQRNVLHNLILDLKKDSFETSLVFGVTGSGKTAIYQELARFCISLNKTIFVLAPEVALAQKLFHDFKNIFHGYNIFLYHGYQTTAKREKLWLEIAAMRKPCIVIGTRSAIFLPARNVGCIILDEEHDSSYKQDENFAYHCKELAWFRMMQERGLLVLGSATPDIRTFYSSEKALIKRLELSRRVAGKALPPIELVPIPPGPLMGPEMSLLSPLTKEVLGDCVKKGEQAVILLNRRGYSPMIYCLECAKTLRCPNCAIGLAYHKDVEKLVCHYCGFSISYPSPCPDCGKMNFLSIGEGTERISEHLEKIAGCEVLRLDRDTTRTPGKINDILTSFASFQSPFLAGTQMLSKGHHFPNVTVAVVADGDIGLNLPDYRASEKTFQLLIQAAGRAGRGSKPGTVLIQTRNPQHYCWKYLLNYDYRGFYREELERRKRYMYPPFVKLSLLRFSCLQEDADAKEKIMEGGKNLLQFGREAGLKVYGPAPAPIAFLRNRARFQCMLKGDSWKLMRKAYFYALELFEKDNIRVFLDMDPVNML